jgi:phospholipid/cholesterol/gamma-HCH transport system substrate-binding protein
MGEDVSWKYAMLGVSFLGVLALLVVLAVAQYDRAFDRTVPVTLKADRSGLLMEPGAAVKLHGVEVGSVAQVSTDGDGAVLALELIPDQAARVPSDVSANLVPSTLFGSKYVELRGGGTGEHIEAGAVIDRTEVTVELDNTFDAVMRTLRAMPPSKLNAALTAVADALRGNGKNAGELITELDAYLAGLNPSLPDLGERLPEIATVADNYGGVTDDLAATAANLGGTASTLVERQRELATFLRSLTELSDSTGELLARDGEAVVTTVDTLRPTARLLARYSPVLPCFLRGKVRNAENIRAVIGGPEFGGTHSNAHVTMSSLPGIPPYEYPRDLPKKGVDTGPDCHGLPDVQGIPPYVPYDTGTNPYPNKSEETTLGPQPLALLLFGPLSPVGGGR